MDLTGTWTGDVTVEIAVDGEVLVLRVDGREHRLRRVAAATPPEEEGTLYRHPTGGQLRVPKGWQITQHPQLGLVLVPPEQAMTIHGPAELYLVSALPAPGIQRVEDPQVLAHVDAQLRQVVPTLGPASRPETRGPGVLVTWEGRNVQTGAPVLAAALLRLGDGQLSGIIALGETARVRARLSTLEQIFASFRKGEGRRDPALVGVWHHWSYQGSSSMYSGASTSSETRRVMQLGADGSVVERSSHEGIGNFTGKDGLGNTAWTAGYGSQSNDGRTGTWTAGDGMLYVQWSDGASAAWQYQLGGAPGSRRLVLLAPGAREPIEWTEQR